ncbi:hypothetical protein [Streptomyces kanasensis]|uniref:hypothetical protein n=1 Tax=Streptomyces kanasensis TaxID=936756 RepID=UPI0038272F17
MSVTEHADVGKPGDMQPEERTKRLDEVAKILAGALVAVSGLLAALGLTSDRVFTALNNSPLLLVVAAVLAFAAIYCSIQAIMRPATVEGNKTEALLLQAGGALYIAALAVALWGAADQASGNGRPTITEVSISGEAAKKVLSFKVRADGVDRDDHVAIFIRPLIETGENQFDSAAKTDVYAASLRSDDKGVIDQKVVLPVAVGKATHLNISVSNSGDKGVSKCNTTSKTAPACVRLRIS